MLLESRILRTEVLICKTYTTNQSKLVDNSSVPTFEFRLFFLVKKLKLGYKQIKFA